MYVTLKFHDKGCCRIRSVSYDGNQWIATNERHVVMPWKMVTRHGKNMTLAEAVGRILSHQESKAKEHERREREKYPPELKLHEYEDNEENPFYDAPTASSLTAGCKSYNQLDYFKKIGRAYQG